MSAPRAPVVLVLGLALAACATVPASPSTPSPTVAAASATAPTRTSSPRPDPPTPSPTPEPTGVPVPLAPTEVHHFVDEECLGEACDGVQWTHTVLWRTPPSADTMILVLGVTECLEKPADPKVQPDMPGPCLLPDTVLPASALRPFRSAPASDGWLSWAWADDGSDGTLLDGLVGFPESDGFYALIVAASNAAGRSPYVIADPGEWSSAIRER